jgi:hypothetical protein
MRLGLGLVIASFLHLATLPVSAACDEWDSVYRSDVGEAGAYATIVFLDNYSCATCPSVALISGFEDKKLRWTHSAKYYCFQGAGGCAVELDSTAPAQNTITFVPVSPEIPAKLVVGGLFKAFYYSGLRPKRLDGRSWKKDEYPSGIVDVFSFSACRPSSSVKMVDEFEISGTKMREVAVEFLSPTGLKVLDGVIVNCNTGFPQINVEGINYVLDEEFDQPQDAPPQLPLKEIWQQTCE